MQKRKDFKKINQKKSRFKVLLRSKNFFERRNTLKELRNYKRQLFLCPSQK